VMAPGYAQSCDRAVGGGDSVLLSGTRMTTVKRVS
jgi:hypothetical protein